MGNIIRKIIYFLDKLIEVLLWCLLIIIFFFTLGILIFNFYIGIKIGIVILIYLRIWLLKSLLVILGIFSCFVKYICENGLEDHFFNSFNDNQHCINDWKYYSDHDFQNNKNYLESSGIPSRDLILHESSQISSQGSSIWQPRFSSESDELRYTHNMSLVDIEISRISVSVRSMSVIIEILGKSIQNGDIILESYKKSEINLIDFANRHIITVPEIDSIYLIIPNEFLSESELISLKSHIKNYIDNLVLCQANFTQWGNGPKRSVTEHAEQLRLFLDIKTRFELLMRNR